MGSSKSKQFFSTAIVLTSAVTGLVLFQPAAAAIVDCGSAGQNCSDYTNKQGSFNENHDKMPMINNAGDIVWKGRPAGTENEFYEIYFRSGATGVTEQITNDLLFDDFPALNDFGEISWMTFDGNLWNINLYSGGSTEQVGSSVLQPYPKINDLSDVAWIGTDIDNYDAYEIFLNAGGVVDQITDNATADVQIRINDSGDLVWRGRGDLILDQSFNIYTRIGGEVEQVTDNDLLEYMPQISNNGHLVWEINDGEDDEIVFRLDQVSGPQQITDNSTQDCYPMINDSGTITWQGYDGNDWEIFIYADDVITQITNNSYDDLRPKINGAGDLAWLVMGATELEIHLFEAATQTISKLSNAYGGHFDSVPDINDEGQVVWMGWDGNDFEVIIASPQGSIHDDVYFYPENLNLQSEAKKFTAYIDLPEPFSAADINPESVVITMISPANSTAEPLPEPLFATGKHRVGDYDKNDIIDIMVEFDRQALIALIIPLGVTGQIDLSVAGELHNGSPFTGVNTINIIDKKMEYPVKASPLFRKLKNKKSKEKKKQ